MRPALLASVLVLGWTGAADAASFDCTRAAAPLEKAICADPALSAADEKLAEAYAAALAATLNPRELRAEQTEWLGTRKGNAAALLDQYRERTEDLHQQAEDWRRVPREIPAPTARASCVAFPDAPEDASCAVEEFGQVKTAHSPALFYQLQGWSQDNVRVGGGAIVFGTAGDKADTLIPLAAFYVDNAYYGTPAIQTGAGAGLLLVQGHLGGTGIYNADALYELSAKGLESIDAESWQRDLERRLPKGLEVWKGIFPNYTTMTATTPLWKPQDGNCCPTGGKAAVTLALAGHRLVIEHVVVTLGAAAARGD